MADLVKTFLKKVAERRRLYLDYSVWLETTETLVDTQVAVSPFDAAAPVTVTTGYTDVTNKKIVMFVSGGAANINYTLRLTVRTNQGQTKVDDLGLKVTA